MASTMSAIEHRGWQIESRSYEADGNRWCPKSAGEPSRRCKALYARRAGIAQRDAPYCARR